MTQISSLFILDNSTIVISQCIFQDLAFQESLLIYRNYLESQNNINSSVEDSFFINITSSQKAIFDIIDIYGSFILTNSVFQNMSGLSILTMNSLYGDLYLESIEFSHIQISDYYVEFEKGLNASFNNITLIFSDDRNAKTFGGGAFYFSFVNYKQFKNVRIKNILSTKSVFGITIIDNADISEEPLTSRSVIYFIQFISFSIFFIRL